MNRSDLLDLNGLLLIDKPARMTSHDVVRRVRRMVRMKRVGHGGTLDPFATGLLVVAVGRATRVLQYVQDSDKEYAATVVLGVETDSGDIEGDVITRNAPEAWPLRPMVERVIQQFVGEIEQVPPAHSAIKVGGRKLYELARAGIEVDVPIRRVTVHDIRLRRYEPPELDIIINCGKGTYVRSLARDIGAALGIGGYCHALRRTRSGGFSVEQAHSLDTLAEIDLRENWASLAVAPDRALGRLPAVTLAGDGATAWYHGRSVPLPGSHGDAALVRAYDARGRFLGVGRTTAGSVKPTLVFPVEPDDADARIEDEGS
jgi:tRNA pseudouridine55 synthase